jgi:DNA adenine methylase
MSVYAFLYYLYFIMPADLPLQPFFCRIGSKRKYTQLLEYCLPQHTIYVEGFVGGGALFFAKKPSTHEVINDLDSQLVDDYLRVARVSPTTHFPSLPQSVSRLRKWWVEQERSGTRSVAIGVLMSLVRRCSGFMSKQVSQPSQIFRPPSTEKLEHIKDYRERLQNTIICSMDYRDLVPMFDSSSTLFFFDPPYEESKGLLYAKGSDTFDFEEFAKVCHGIRGKVLITLNDSPRIRQAFHKFHLYPYDVKGTPSRDTRATIGDKDRPELLISNYALPMDWKSHLP